MIITFLVALPVGSTLLLAFAAIMIRLLPRSSAASRFSFWQIAVASLLLLPLGIVFLPEVPLGLVSNTQAVPAVLPAQTNVRNILPSILAANNDVPAAAELQANSLPLVETASTIKARSSQGPQIAAASSAAPIVEVTRHEFATIAFAIWLAVAVFLLLRTLLAHLAVALRVHSIDREITPPRKDHSGWLPDSVDLTYSDRQSVPITIGIFRRRIILPAIAEDWTADQLRMVLKHELAHVQRRDVLWQLVTAISTSLFWFQPLAWWADQQLKLERERACDDQVISGGEQAADYATVLVQLAAAFSGRNSIPLGALSMAQKPIERRLAAILSPSTIRTTTNGWFVGLATTIAILVVAGVCSLRPFSPLAIAATVPEPANSNRQESEPDDLAFPSQLTGLVVDEDNQPVAGAELHLTATPCTKFEAYRSGTAQATIDLDVIKTNGEGKYSFSISELKNTKEIWRIDGKAIAANRPPANLFRVVRKGSEQTQSIRTIRFQPGKKITGRVIPPADNANDQLKNLVISVMPIDSFPSQGWCGENVECQAYGRFSVVVARDVRVSIQATADNFAGTGLEVQPEVRELEDIQLQVGKKLTGQLVNREGQPVAGVVVYSAGEAPTLNSQLMSQYQPRFSRSCKTDENGKFDLKPLHGKVSVSLRQSMFDHRSHGKTSDRVPPVVVPVHVDFEEFEGNASVNLKEAKTVQASGTVRWPDGSPVIGIKADLHVMTSRFSSSVFSTETDSSGNYTVLIPENMQSWISVIGGRDSSRQWLFAEASATSDKVTQQGIQSLRLAPLTEDITGLDWKLSKQDVPKPDPTTAAAGELQRILTKMETDTTKSNYRIAGAANDQEKQELTERYEQRRKVHTADLIAFEAKHRGDFAGANALASYIDYANPQQLDEFTANYIDSPNADVVLDGIYSQSYLTLTRKMLTTFAEDSPHATIRATALYQKGQAIALALIFQDLYKNPQWLQHWPDPKTEEEIEVAKYIATLRSLNTEQLLSDFDLIQTTLKTKYSEHSFTITNPGTRVLKERCTNDAGESYADVLQTLRFQLENLKSGQPLPRLAGRDVYGADFDSERLKGKAVLLFFTDQNIDQQEVKELQELKKRYAGRPFEIVSVMTDLKVEDAKAAVDTSKITWPTLYDAGQKIVDKWMIAERLLIDHQGIIHRRAMDDDMDETIELLVENAERNED